MRATYITSDLHLHDDDQPFLFTAAKERLFEKLAAEIISKNARLILAGDVFDLTAMNPPTHGLPEFFTEVLGPQSLNTPLIQEALRFRELPEQLKALGNRFPGFFAVLATLASIDALTILPGNHDCIFEEVSARRMLTDSLGVSHNSIRWTEFDALGQHLIATHGNQFDSSNRTQAGCFNRGMVITQAVYRAIMPACIALGLPYEIVAAIPAVRPEEEIVRGLELYLGEEQARIMMLAFVRLLERNHYFRGFQGLLMTFLVRQIPLLSPLMRRTVTASRIRAALPRDTDLKAKARQGAAAIRKQTSQCPAVVVLGHTHELDFTENYVNLGTWIDHISGLSPEHRDQADSRLPVLCLETDGTSALYDARGLAESATLKECPRLWAFNSLLNETDAPTSSAHHQAPL